jgi:hypothetical protein
MKRITFASIICALLGFSSPSIAANDPNTNQSDPNETACNAFFKVNCVLMAGPNFNVGSNRVASANVVNGIVRVSNDQNISISVLSGITHFWPTNNPDVNWGIFGAGGFNQSTGGAGTFGAFALGGALDFEKAKINSYPMDVYFGVTFTPNTQVLGDGIQANRPLPSGETEVRYKTTTAVGLLLAIGTHF